MVAKLKTAPLPDSNAVKVEGIDREETDYNRPSGPPAIAQLCEAETRQIECQPLISIQQSLDKCISLLAEADTKTHPVLCNLYRSR